jgi:hypothetical protein
VCAVAREHPDLAAFDQVHGRAGVTLAKQRLTTQESHVYEPAGQRLAHRAIEPGEQRHAIQGFRG